MRLYHAAGVYVGTQADAKRLDKDFTQVEVPTDKDGLMAFLNRAKIAPQNAVGAPPVVTAPGKTFEYEGQLGVEDADDISDLLGGEPTHQPATIRTGLPSEAFQPAPTTAERVVSQIDTPGIEQIVEVIATSKGQSLRRFAGAVAVRFAELGK